MLKYFKSIGRKKHGLISNMHHDNYIERENNSIKLLKNNIYITNKLEFDPLVLSLKKIQYMLILIDEENEVKTLPSINHLVLQGKPFSYVEYYKYSKYITKYLPSNRTVLIAGSDQHIYTYLVNYYIHIHKRPIKKLYKEFNLKNIQFHAGLVYKLLNIELKKLKKLSMSPETMIIPVVKEILPDKTDKEIKKVLKKHKYELHGTLLELST